MPARLVLIAVILLMGIIPAWAQDDPAPDELAEVPPELVELTATPFPTFTPTVTVVPTPTLVACPAPGVRTAPAGTVTQAGDAPATIAEGFGHGSVARVSLIGPDGQAILSASRDVHASCTVGSLTVPDSAVSGVYVMRWDGRTATGDPIELTDRFIVAALSNVTARIPASCTDAPSMEITYGAGAVVTARGFRPGAPVDAWVVRIGSSMSKPSRLPDLTWQADGQCQIREGFSVTTLAGGDRALFLAGPRHGGGTEITMWRKVELEMRQ